MTNQEILDNAPEGATHYSQGIHYLALNSSNSWMRYDPNGFANAKWFAANDYKLSYSNKNFRSLADIKRIIDLEGVGNEYRRLVADLRLHLEEQE
jgi:hypothetical protein